MPEPNESFPVLHHDVYPGIAPEKFVGSNKGKVVFITGASRPNGLGFATAKAYAQTGANIFLTARNIASLKQAKLELEKYDVKVECASLDVTVEESVKQAVAEAISAFGRIDIVIAAAGKPVHTFEKMFKPEASLWLDVYDANFRGSYLTAHATISELAKTKGYIVFYSSVLAQFRYKMSSAYSIAKHGINRLAEYVDLEYADEGVKSFSLHPGSVKTDISIGIREYDPTLNDDSFKDTAELSAWTQVRLTSGTEDWLSGRYIDVGWDLDVLQTQKEIILEQNALKNRLALPIN